MIKWYAERGTEGLTRAHDSDAGYDLRAVEAYTVEPGKVVQIRTGVHVEMPLDVYGKVCSRSGLVLKHNVGADGGVVDAGYRGEVCVLLRNYGTEPFLVEKGARIGQLVFHKITHDLQEVLPGELSEADRGCRGFGSTGGAA